MLTMCSLRTRAGSPEAHVARIRALIREHRPRNLIVDPLSALAQVAAENALATHAALQLLDLAKNEGITFFSSSLLSSAASLSEETPFGMSTIADTWLHVSYVIQGGERNRALTIIKARGTGHSSQVRELILSDAGITLADVYAVGGEVLMGTLRWERENQRQREHQAAERDGAIRQREAEIAVAATKARFEALEGERMLREAELAQIVGERRTAHEANASEGSELVQRRGGEPRGTRPGARQRRVAKAS
jgi:circadian clock protein KaiC